MIALRPRTLEDAPLMTRLMLDAKADVVALLDSHTAEQIIQLQVRAQELEYTRQPGQSCQVIEADGDAVGRLWTSGDESHRCVLDIAILPEHRGRGIGTHVLSQLIDDTSVVTLSVRRGNPAMRLYERLGFDRIGDDSLDVSMVRRQPKTAS